MAKVVARGTTVGLRCRARRACRLQRRLTCPRNGGESQSASRERQRDIALQVPLTFTGLLHAANFNGSCTGLRSRCNCRPLDMWVAELSWGLN